MLIQHLVTTIKESQGLTQGSSAVTTFVAQGLLLQPSQALSLNPACLAQPALTHNGRIRAVAKSFQPQKENWELNHWEVLNGRMFV